LGYNFNRQRTVASKVIGNVRYGFAARVDFVGGGSAPP
jgi:hypothetical protein